MIRFALLRTLTLPIATSAFAAFILLSSTALANSSDFWVTCGKTRIVDFRLDTVPYAHANFANRLDPQIIDAFDIPEINRAAYAAYRLKVSIPMSACTAPADPTGFDFTCNINSPVEVVLEAALPRSDAYNNIDIYTDADYKYRHELTVPNFRLSAMRVTKQNRNQSFTHDYNFVADFGQFSVATEFGYAAFSGWACGYQTRCYRNNANGDFPLEFDQGWRPDCTG